MAAVAEERASDDSTTKPPKDGIDEAQPGLNGGVFIEGTDKWLTFEFTRGRKRAQPAVGRRVQRRVRPRARDHAVPSETHSTLDEEAAGREGTTTALRHAVCATQTRSNAPTHR